MSSDFVTETAKQRPVFYDVDVAIAGSGLCSTFAAIAAGRCGAKTLVIERFGTMGGNIGPGMMGMGSLYYEAEVSLPGGLAGIAKEFVQRLQKLRARGEPGESNAGRDFWNSGEEVRSHEDNCRGRHLYKQPCW